MRLTEEERNSYAMKLPRPVTVMVRCVRLVDDLHRCHVGAEREWQCGSYTLMTCEEHTPPEQKRPPTQ
jgi:hypothetical protein